jgi:murein L,D-transpeptidase YcbB/YkuD
MMNTPGFGIRSGPPLSRTALLAFCVVLLTGFLPQGRTQAADGVAASLQQALAGASDLHHPDLPQGLDMLRALYAKRGFLPIWHQSGVPTAQARRLAQALRDARDYGLDPADYDADWIDAQVQELLAARDAQEARWAALDLRLSSAVLRFVMHLRYGRVDPRAGGFELSVPRADLDPVETVKRLAGASDTAAALAEVKPPFHHYRLLEAALEKYRWLALDDTLTALPALPRRTIRSGERYSGAAALRRLLAALGDLGPDALAASHGSTLDDALVAALRSFQARHGLDVDGTLGKRTFAALTVPLARRARQIELTLERWRWLPPFETPPIVVNIPAFRLYALRTTDDRESDVLRMDVIVGQSFPETQTPVFLAEMKYVVFRPYWDVPDSIVQKEMLPQILANPGFLKRNHLELVGGGRDDSPVVPPTPKNIQALASGAIRLRQQPGPDNALGAIKFMLPNAHSVYLHSTPNKRLFKESNRAFSHGCIRVSDPVALAAHVLRNAKGDWTAETIEQAMKGEPNQRVILSKPIQVMILYGTALAMESGQVRFFDDIYGYDEKLEVLLQLRNN